MPRETGMPHFEGEEKITYVFIIWRLQPEDDLKRAP